MRVLFLSPRFPLPVTKGDTLRAWQFIRHLATEHEVTLASFVSGHEERAQIPAVEAVCRVVAIPFSRVSGTLGLLRGFADNAPFQALYFQSHSMQAAIRDLLPLADVVHCNTLRMAGNLPNCGLRIADCGLENPNPPVFPAEAGIQDPRNPAAQAQHVITDFAGFPPSRERREAARLRQSAIANPQSAIANPQSAIRNPQSPRLVVDFIDALSLGYERMAHGRGLAGRIVSPIEVRRLRRFEQALRARAVLSMAVAEEDAEALGEGVQVVPHGVDTRVFYPPAADAAPRRHIIMTGNLGYLPNIEAAEWLVNEVMPRVHAVRPEVRLRLAGADPAPRVRRLARDFVEVTGRVPDMADELRRAAVAAAPILSGAGIKNKLLEAMACATPVVATPEANAGVHAEDGKEILLADTAYAFADKVLTVLEEPQTANALGSAGLAFVQARFSFEATGKKLLALYRALEQEF